MPGLAPITSDPRFRRALQVLPWALLLLIVAGLFAPTVLEFAPMRKEARFYEPARGRTTQAVATLQAPTQEGGGGGGGDDQPAQPAFDRKIVRTGTLQLVVKDAPTAVQQLQALAQGLGGYVESSTLTQVGETMNGSVKLRIPAARFDEARMGARGIGLRVESETVEASDVTRQFVDLEASLRNFRAEEAQYLEIMKRASKTEDVLQVAEHLSDVRGRIERTQGELNLLSHQVDMSTLTINLVAQAEARVWGLEWRPLANARRAVRGLLAGLADYADSMVALLLYLPLILLWIATVVFFAVIAWKLLRWVWKRFLKRAPAAPAAQ